MLSKYKHWNFNITSWLLWLLSRRLWTVFGFHWHFFYQLLIYLKALLPKAVNDIYSLLHLLRIICRKLHLASFVANATYFSNDSSIFTFGSHVTLRSGSRPCARARDVTQVNDLGHNFNIYGDTWEFDDQTKNEQIVPSLQFKHEFVYTIRFQEMKLIVECQEVFAEQIKHV